MTQVLPALIPNSAEQLLKEAGLVRAFVDIVQIDLMDGMYAPTTSWPFLENSWEEASDAMSKLGVDFELHCMVEAPEEHIEEFLSWEPQGVLLHPDSATDIDELKEKILEAGSTFGLAFKPSQADEIERYIALHEPSFIQIMGNEKIGYHGVMLEEGIYDIARMVRGFWDGPLAIDIGVNQDTAPSLVEAGFDRLVSGSAILNAPDIGKQIKEFSEL